MSLLLNAAYLNPYIGIGLGLNPYIAPYTAQYLGPSPIIYAGGGGYDNYKCDRVIDKITDSYDRLFDRVLDRSDIYRYDFYRHRDHRGHRGYWY